MISEIAVSYTRAFPHSTVISTSCDYLRPAKLCLTPETSRLISHLKLFNSKPRQFSEAVTRKKKWITDYTYSFFYNNQVYIISSENNQEYI